MSITIREVTENEKQAFDEVVHHPVQSWEWGEFRQQMGNKVIRLGKFDGDKLLEGYTLTLHKIPKTKYFLAMCTQCPLPSQEVLDALKELAKRENLIFIRLEPYTNKLTAGSWQLAAALRPGRPFFNKSTFIIDLTKSEEELLKNMHPKTRYNIRVAERHGVEVVEDNSDQAFESYLNLMDETTKRQGYFSHGEKYHRKMWVCMKQSGISHLFLAKYKGKILSTWILFVWHNTLYYPYGASSQENREVMASTKLMWEGIKFGKNLCLQKFDLWGADEGTGYGRFKERFGSTRVESIGTWDLVTNKTIYPLYRLAEETRWKVLKAKAKLFPSSSFR